MMSYLAFVILILFSVVGFFAIFFTTFGTFLIVAGAVIFSMMTHFSFLSINSLFVIGALYVFGEIMEYVAVVVGAKKLGASNTAVLGAILGGIFGAMVGVGLMGVGVILGTFLGIFLGAFLLEFLVRRDFKQSIKAGIGGILGRVGSVAAKLVIAFCIYGIMIFQIVSKL